jgi:hypothetical protein
MQKHFSSLFTTLDSHIYHQTAASSIPFIFLNFNIPVLLQLFFLKLIEQKSHRNNSLILSSIRPLKFSVKRYYPLIIKSN